MKAKKSLSTCLAIAALFYAGAALFQPATAAAPKPRLAVYVTGDKTENEKKALANEILNALVRSGQYTPAVRINDFLAAIAQEQKKQRVSDAQFRDIAQQHGIEYICVGDITDVFNTSYLSLRVVNAATGESEAVSSVYSDLKRFEDFAGVHDKVVGAMFTVASVAAPKKAAAAPESASEKETPAPAVDASYYYKQGYANSQSKDHDGAIANYTEALKLDPKLVYALIARGSAYYSKGDYQSAVEDYSRSIELEPNDAGVFNNRGNAYRKMGNYDMARADYEAALRIDPNNAEAKESLDLIQLDKSGEEKRTPFTRKYGLRYGVTGGLYIMELDLHKESDYYGWGLSGGAALTYQFNDWLAVVSEFNGIYRDMHGYDKYADKIEELIVSVPVMVRVNTPWWPSFGAYAEAGIQAEVPYESKIRVSQGGYTERSNITNRNNDIQIVTGGGFFFNLGVTWYIGTRGVISLNDFAGSDGFLYQAGGVLSLIY